MGLNKIKGNMYEFLDYTWNPIRGKCSHDCSYCSIKSFGDPGELRLVEEELNIDLGEDKFIFVGSSIDMFADDVPEEWILKVISKCKEHKNNKYLFQTKNPIRYKELNKYLPAGNVYAITLESNRSYPSSYAPLSVERAKIFSSLPIENKMLTIEPIMDFDIIPFISMIKDINPKIVVIGADSKRSNLVEPSVSRVKMLIKELKKFLPKSKIIQKNNLYRILEGNAHEDATPIYSSV